MSAAGVPGLAALSDDPTPELVRELLHGVIDPELGVDIVELGLLREVTVRAGVARIRFTVTTPACPLTGYIEDEIHACLQQAPALRQVLVESELEPPWKPEDMSEVARAALGWD
ncbi:MAG: metal-sulfur cluster assembly factor [Actinobacteria bacterium]|nr:metal-sulfur cluster assembly factor [Actinomycetota bacterium]